MDSEDGQVFVRSLAHFVRTHERALANALHRQRGQAGQATAGASNNSESPPQSITLSDALSRSYLSFSHPIKPSKLALTPHHLYYLLHQFEDLRVNVGPMNVRLETLQHDNGPSNYVSFLGHAPKLRGRQSDTVSLRSVSSVQSVMSSMSSLWANLTLANSAAKAEKRRAQHHEDIKYLYSCFTKIPALKLSPDPRARKISGYEEFPLDTAVPLFAFKNVSALEICDEDFRKFHGWDRLAEQLRSLTVRRANVNDPIDLLQNIVLDDIEKRRKRSSNSQVPTTPSTPGLPWPLNSPNARQLDGGRTYFAPGSPLLVDQRRGSSDGAMNIVLARGGSSDGKPGARVIRKRSNSPTRPVPMKYGSMKRQSGGSIRNRRSSGSSGSSTHETTPGHSTVDLLLSGGFMPSSKWRFLRHLSLAENGLVTLTSSSLAPVAGTLQSLDLSGNLFTEVPEALASLTHLRALNLSGCMIKSLNTLSRNPLPAISVLNLRSNRLRDIVGIERLLSLERVDLRDNNIHDPMELARMTGIPDIVDLFVVKNPFTKLRGNYRVTIFNLFRSTPGRFADVTIDALGPTYSEKKQLVDMAPEPAKRPVVRPTPEEEENDPPTLAGCEPTELEIQALALQQQELMNSSRYTHRRATSDFGPQSMRRKRKAPRRRIVELSPTEAGPPPPVTHQEQPPELADPPPKTPTDSDQPETPCGTPVQPHIPPQILPATSSQCPRLETSFTTSNSPPKIRNPSIDDDDNDIDGPSADLTHDLPESDLHRQKLESLNSDFGPGWLPSLNETRAVDESPLERERQTEQRSFSPASKESTIKGEQIGAPEVDAGARQL